MINTGQGSVETRIYLAPVVHTVYRTVKLDHPAAEETGVHEALLTI